MNRAHAAPWNLIDTPLGCIYRLVRRLIGDVLPEVVSVSAILLGAARWFLAALFLVSAMSKLRVRGSSYHKSLETANIVRRQLRLGVPATTVLATTAICELATGLALPTWGERRFTRSEEDESWRS